MKDREERGKRMLGFWFLLGERTRRATRYSRWAIKLEREADVGSVHFPSLRMATAEEGTGMRHASQHLSSATGDSAGCGP